MQIKNKKKLLFIFLSILFVFNSNINAEEFDITAKEILIDKEINFQFQMENQLSDLH